MTKAKTLLAEATQHSLEEIPDNASINNFPAWNSLAHMRLILAMESQLGHELNGEDVINIASLDEVIRFL